MGSCVRRRDTAITMAGVRGSARRGLSFDVSDEPPEEVAPFFSDAKVSERTPALPVQQRFSQAVTAESEDEITPPLEPPRAREAWATSPPLRAPLDFEVEPPPSATVQSANARPAPIPHAHLALPRPVLAAAMSQKKAEAGRGVASAGRGIRSSYRCM